MPNTIDAVTELLRAAIIQISDRNRDEIDVISELFLKKNPSFIGTPKFSDIVSSGLVKVNIDPHTSIVSLGHLVKSIEFFNLKIGNPFFLHNETTVPFICSDNPVIYHIYSKNINDIEPYSVSHKQPVEMIFPISSKLVIILNTLSKKKFQHESTFSLNTVRRINEKVALYADRYIFANCVEALKIGHAFKEKCPRPNLEKSKIGNGRVFKIGYEFGPPRKLSNEWKYDFE